MSKYDYEITDIEALSLAHPKATLKSPNRQELRKLVNAARTLSITLPGVKLLEVEQTNDADKDIPAHLTKKAGATDA